MADLESVIASSIESVSGGDGGDGGEVGAEPVETVDTGDTGGAGEETPPAAADDAGDEGDGEPAAEPVPAPVAKPAKKAGPIPFEKHEKVLANARAERQAEIDTLTQRLEKVKWAETEDAQASIAALQLADTNPQKFAEILLTDQTLGPIFRSLVGGAAPAVPAKIEPAAATSEEPQPDVLLPDGSVGYSAAASKKLVDYQLAQFAKSQEEKFNKRLEEQFGEVKDVVEERKARVAFDRAKENMRPVLENARAKWPKFAENETAIKEFMLKPENARMSLHDAYIAVAIPKLQTSEDEMRTRIIAELNGRPAAVVPAPKTVGRAPKAAGGDLESVIKNSIASLEQ